MRALKWIVLALVLIVAGVYGIGWLLPVAHVASRSADLSAAPQSVYDAIADVEHYPQWWPEISRVEMLQPSKVACGFDSTRPPARS